jgi:putative ABC transport system permease protein
MPGLHMWHNMKQTFLWAVRDFRGSLKHFRLVLICLLISIAAITAVQVTGASIFQAIARNAQTILGGDWVVRQLYAPVGDAERDWLRARQAKLVETIEMRAMLSRPDTHDSALIELKAVTRGYPLYGTVDAEPQDQDFHHLLDKGVVIDPALAERLSVKIGDDVQLGTEIFKVTGFVTHEPDRAGGGRFGLAPRVFVSGYALPKTGLIQQGSMVNYDLRVAWPQLTPLKKLQAEFEAQFKNATWRLTDTEKASPQIQRFVNNLMQFLTLIGLSSLLIGGIGIGNGMRAYLQTRMNTIAVFKSVGMASRHIRAIYIWQIMIVALIGTALGVAVGSVLPFFLLPLLNAMLPFAMNIVIVPQAVLIPFAFGILTSLIFSLWPLGQAEKTSPLILFRQQQAVLSDKPAMWVYILMALCVAILCMGVLWSVADKVFVVFFMVGAVLSFALFYGIGRGVALLARSMSRQGGFVQRLALDNIGRKGNATAQMLVSLGIGLTVLSSIAMIERNIRGNLQDNLPYDAPSFFFMDIQPDQKIPFVDLLKAFPQTSHVVVTPNLRGRLVSVNGVPAEQALKDKRESWLLSNDRGFTYTDTLPAHSTILEGAWWPADYNGPPLVSVVEDVQRGFGVKPGDMLGINILGRTIEAKIANVRDVNWTNFTINFAMTFAPGTLEGAPHSWLATVVADSAQEVALQRAVTKAFPNVSMIRLSDAIETVSQILRQMNQAVRVMGALALITGLIVLIEALLATRQRRQYDTVILKVVGVPRSVMERILWLEFCVLGALASILSVGLATGVSWAILHVWMDQPWHFYPQLAGVAMLCSFAMIVLTGWISLRRVLREPALSYLRNE